MQINNTVILITGASSGIGLQTSIQLLKMGYKVYGAARRTQLLSTLEQLGGHSLFLDLTNEESIKKCINTIIEKEGKIDVLVNNAGYGLGGPLENIPVEKAKDQFEVNVFGLTRMIQLVLPYMKQNHSGRIINISSVAGRFSSPYLGWYHASKYCVEALSDSLRLEVKPFGIKVSIIEPGLIQTNWGNIAGNYINQYSENTDYAEYGKKVSGAYLKYYSNSKFLSKPEVISKAIIKAIKSKNPKIRYTTGKFSKFLIIFHSLFSESFVDFWKIKFFKIN